jgi:hypothetical protein
VFAPFSLTFSGAGFQPVDLLQHRLETCATNDTSRPGYPRLRRAGQNRKQKTERLPYGVPAFVVVPGARPTTPVEPPGIK